MAEGAFHYGQHRLENDLVILEPFEPGVHAAPFVEITKAHPELFTYIPFPVVSTEAEFRRDFYDANFRASPSNCLYAVLDKVTSFKADDVGSNFAGIAALSSTNPTDAVTEIGVVIFPAFQRTHVASNTVGLILQWTLDPPSAGGLGLRRVEWKCHSENTASRDFALRMGFEFEGIARWQRVFPRGTVALPTGALQRRNGTKEELPGRHTAMYSLVWDEWDDKRPAIATVMKRRQ
nr:uncharacterized protein CFP56_29931 [Quercus suber]